MTFTSDDIQNLWSNDFVQKNPRKSYHDYYTAEYEAISTFINGGQEPAAGIVKSRLGLGLVAAERERRAGAGGTTPPPPSTDYPVPAAIAGKGYSLTFHDEFDSLNANADGSLSDAKMWGKMWWKPTWPANRVFVKDSILHIQSALSDANHDIDVATRKVTSPKVSNGTVTDMGGSTSFLYGYFECRYACDMSLAHWPAFWLFSLFHSFTGSPGSTADCQKAAPYTNGTADKLLTSELDVVEGGWKDRATGVNVFSGTVHPNTSTPCGVPDSWTLAQYKHTETGFHTYGALWTPTTVSWFYDDVFRGSCAAPPSFYQPMFLVLSSVRHNDAADKPAMLDTQVDWVRVWQDSSCKRWNA